MSDSIIIDLVEAQALSEIQVPFIPLTSESEWDQHRRISSYLAIDGHVKKLRICGKRPSSDTPNLPILRLNPAINKLTWLEELQIVNLTISTDPKFKFNLPTLQRLELLGNKLPQVPHWISNLTSLQEIALLFNEIKNLPSFFSRFQHLTALDLSYNAFTLIPTVLRSLPSLKHLELNNNALTSLPTWISDLSQLENLSVMHNRLTDLPEELGDIKTLQNLNISMNQLQSIPDSIATLPNLKVLHINNNLLESMPLSLWEKLTPGSSFSCNQWTFPPWEIQNKTLKEITNYIRAYTPERFLKNVEQKLKNCAPLIPEEKFYPELLKLSQQLEILCTQYPDSPTVIEIKELLVNTGKLRKNNRDQLDLKIYL